jgi:single-stranded-DNA-specific exonuclease
MALRKRLRDTGLAADVNLLQYLDLVALGTVADVMPLTGVNRIFVSFGLKEINKTRRPGYSRCFSQPRSNPTTRSVSGIWLSSWPRGSMRPAESMMPGSRSNSF